MSLKTNEATMNELNSYYAKILHYGLLVIREAALQNDMEWIKAESQFLHNIPSLIDEPNVQRHEYFWSKERQAYIDWVNASGGETARKRMRMFYEPIWKEMAPLMTELLSAARITT